MLEFIERILTALRAAWDPVDRALAVIFRLFWRPIRYIWCIVKPTRFSAATLLAGGFLLVGTDQGRELAVRFADSDALFSLEFVIFLLSVGWFAFQAWYWARVSFHLEHGLDHRDAHEGKRWAPRIYAGAAFGFAALSLWLAARSGQGDYKLVYVTLIVGAAFVGLLIFRMPLVHWIKGDEGGTAGGEKMRPEGVHELPLVSRLTLFLSVIFSLVTLIAILVWPVGIGRTLGAAAIAFLAFGHIVPVGSALVIRSRESGFPIITTVLLLAVAFSPFADNHQVPAVADPDAPQFADRPDAAEAAEIWIDATHSPETAGGARPVIFVSTAGGGLRAAYWTAVVLGALQDECPGLERYIFSISGVSGGSVGAAAYATALHNDMAAQASGPCVEAERPDTGVGSQMLDVLGNEFLGPTFAAMLYPDLIQRIIPYPVLPDRGAALAGAWNSAWHDVCDSSERCAADAGDLDAAFLKVAGVPAKGAPWRPILLLNGTHQETGKRIIASNIKVTVDDFLDAFDLHDLVRHDVSMGMAALNSARFTYVSPAGRLVRSDGAEMGHVLDGGYFENYGAVTGAEIARAAVKQFERQRIPVRPIVIQISSDPDLPVRDLPAMDRPEDAAEFLAYGTGPGDAAHWFANEVAGPVRGVLATRTARGVLANKTVSDVVGSLREEPHRFPTVIEPVFVHFRMCADEEGRKPPLGWAMSNTSRQHLRGLIEGGCDAARSDNAKALATVLDAMRNPVPVICAFDATVRVTRCKAPEYR